MVYSTFVEEEETKCCSSCERELPLSAFSKRAASKDGLNAACRECLAARVRARTSEQVLKYTRRQNARIVADPEKHEKRKKKQREYNQRPEVAAKRAEWCRERRKDPEVRVADNMRGRLYKYGLTLEQYEQMLVDQDYACAICLCDLRELTFNNIHIDHDHACCPTERSCGECVRKLLCRSCNYLLGNAKDDPAILQAAIQYLLSNQRECASDGGSAVA